jgi:hypothetical protein
LCLSAFAFEHVTVAWKLSSTVFPQIVQIFCFSKVLLHLLFWVGKLSDARQRAEDMHFVWNMSLPYVLPNLYVAIRGITWGIMTNCSQRVHANLSALLTVKKPLSLLLKKTKVVPYSATTSIRFVLSSSCFPSVVHMGQAQPNL